MSAYGRFVGNFYIAKRDAVGVVPCKDSGKFTYKFRFFAMMFLYFILFMYIIILTNYF